MQRKQMVLTELPPPKSATASFLIAIAAVSFTFSVVGILTGPETDAGNYGAAIKLVRIAGVGFISGWVAHVVLQSRLTLVRSAQVSFVAMHATAAWQSRWDDLKDMNNFKLIFIYVALAAWALIYGLNGILVERHRYAHAPHYLLLLRTINSAKIFIVGLPLWCVSVYGRAGDHYKFMGTSTEEVLALALFFLGAVHSLRIFYWLAWLLLLFSISTDLFSPAIQTRSIMLLLSQILILPRDVHSLPSLFFAFGRSGSPAQKKLKLDKVSGNGKVAAGKKRSGGKSHGKRNRRTKTPTAAARKASRQSSGSNS